MNIYVGNISRTVTEQDLKEAFEAFGTVQTASIFKDKFSGESRGFGFAITLYSQPRADAPEGESALFLFSGIDVGGSRSLMNFSPSLRIAPRGQGRKIYEVDLLVCPRCGGRMKVVAFIMGYSAVDRIMEHLELTFVAEKPPPAHVFETVAMMAAEESGEYE